MDADISETVEPVDPATVSSTEVEEDHPSASRPQVTARRSRVSLACQRCKQRKQKVFNRSRSVSDVRNKLTEPQCNGEQPSCARCIKLKLDCHYVMPTHPKPGQAKIYIKALEERVAELEHQLAKEGDRLFSSDHWPDDTTAADESDQQEGSSLQPLLNAVRDLSLDVAGSYIGGASTITLGRALETALKGKTELSMSRTYVSDDSVRSRSSSFIDNRIVPSTRTIRIGQIDPELADMMVHAYLKHLCTNFPIMFSTDILELHRRRHDLDNMYQVCILNLIYGLGSHFLRAVSSIYSQTRAALNAFERIA